MRRRLLPLALSVLASCGGATATGEPTTPVAPAGAAEVVASEGAENGHAPDRVAAAGAEPAAAATPLEPEGGELISVGVGFHPDPIVRRSGAIGGPRAAEELDPSCRGYISAAPNYVLKLDVPMASLRVLVATGSDATLVMRLADGRVLCDDDTEGLNPILSGPFPPGRHSLWVGAYSPSDVGSLTYTMAITQQGTLSTHALDALAPTP